MTTLLRVFRPVLGLLCIALGGLWTWNAVAWEQEVNNARYASDAWTSEGRAPWMADLHRIAGTEWTCTPVQELLRESPETEVLSETRLLYTRSTGESYIETLLLVRDARLQQRFFTPSLIQRWYGILRVEAKTGGYLGGSAERAWFWDNADQVLVDEVNWIQQQHASPRAKGHSTVRHLFPHEQPADSGPHLCTDERIRSMRGGY